jgi:hypothetical protein
MSNLLQDFFRPDLGASNRALKRYLDEEGLRLGFRDLVCLRSAAEAGVFFSFALLEAWSSGEFGVPEVTRLLEVREQPEEVCQEQNWSYRQTAKGLLLIGVEGELAAVELEDSLEGGPRESSSTALVPLQAVYGGDSLLSAPGAGGAWKEDELQAASLTLLDGESEEKLVEAFRHLFRAAPHGAARAAVVATALARHRSELNREVADKLEEISPPLGQALRQLFGNLENEGRQALGFLLGAEAAPEPPAWTPFWAGIKTTVLESLARTEKGRQVLRDSLRPLHAVCQATGASVLTHRLLDAFLSRHDLFTPEDHSHLLALLERFAQTEPAAVETLASRLELSADTQERILLGEALRRVYKSRGQTAELERLGQRFAVEALSVGSTAGSLALAQLLAAFGPSVLEQSALTRLDCLSERQTLNAMAMWEQLVGEEPANLERVSALFVRAMRDAEQHWGLLLKSPLLQHPPGGHGRSELDAHGGESAPAGAHFRPAGVAGARTVGARVETDHAQLPASRLVGPVPGDAAPRHRPDGGIPGAGAALDPPPQSLLLGPDAAASRISRPLGRHARAYRGGGSWSDPAAGSRTRRRERGAVGRGHGRPVPLRPARAGDGALDGGAQKWQSGRPLLDLLLDPGGLSCL